MSDQSEWKYILAPDGKTAVQEPDVSKWAEWYKKADRRVAFDTVGLVRISTVFLGLDHSHSFDPHEPPLLWETMIFGATGELEDYCARYTSWEEAVKGHQHAFQLVVGALS